MSAPPHADHRWIRLTPGRLIAGLLIAECLLWLSNRLGWPAWHKGYAVLTGVASVGVVLAAMLLWWLAALLFRGRFQFSLRSLLMLTVVIALQCSWFVSELKEAKRQQAMIAEIREAEGGVFFDYEVDHEYKLLVNAQPPEPAWLRTLLSDDFFDIPMAVNIDRPAEQVLFQVRQLTSLRQVKVFHGNASVGPLNALSNLPRLDAITFTGDDSAFEVSELQGLRPMPGVRSLHIDRINVSDADFAQIVRIFPSLRDLSIGGVSSGDEQRLTDHGLAAVRKLPCIERLNVRSDGLSIGCTELFSGCPSIRELSLDGDCDADGPVQLHDCAALEVLTISRPRPRTLKSWSVEMKRFPRLRQLYLQNVETLSIDAPSNIEILMLRDGNTPGTSLAEIVARCPRLVEVSLWNYRRDPRPILRQLTKTASLRKLDLTGIWLTTEAVEALSSLVQLRELDFGGLTIDDAMLRKLENLRNLESLRLHDAAVTDEGVKRPKTMIPGLHCESFIRDPRSVP
jgi:hypothetical protein